MSAWSATGSSTGSVVPELGVVNDVLVTADAQVIHDRRSTVHSVAQVEHSVALDHHIGILQQV
jgi:hypothetical protein